MKISQISHTLPDSAFDLSEDYLEIDENELFKYEFFFRAESQRSRHANDFDDLFD